MVKPGGTGSPMRHISARFAPLPPSSGFIEPLPSVFLPKRYTNLPLLPALLAAVFFLLTGFFAAVFLAFFAIQFDLLTVSARAEARALRSSPRRLKPPLYSV